MDSFQSYVEYRFNQLETRVKTIELDVEPGVRISEAFDRLSDDIDKIEKRLDRLEHGQNQIKATLDVILRHITGYGQQ
ncbi:hypothetical protein PCC8801_1008 [Rippkaea orientalis PCC 8801]|uniref:Uncharacterized protein n=1 Tax=Rippkaea orientalis (strain PCC 8801 / RF-1) TaxID=41431 RepID=B7K0U3_RIPO1|nr:hypothetical protein [Rippkaea orientalis]ACK65084.1 hypothetical protein PCC8801_1008 [Rippkaea orientalis PCC 8801]